MSVHGQSSRAPAARTHGPASRRIRRGVLGVAVGALLAAAVSILVLGYPGVSPSPSTTGPATTSTASAAEKVFAQAAPGNCLTWTTPTASDLALIDCAEAHRFEVAAEVDLARQPGGQFGAASALPGAVLLTQLRDSLCVPAVNNYLRGRFDPNGLFSVGLIDPGAAAWAAGQRTVRCGLQHVGRTGEQFPIRGRVAELDQSDVAPVGSCESISSGLPTDPVDCAQPHASEAISVVDLGQKFSPTFPAAREQDAYLDETCRAAAGLALGGPDALAGKGLTVFWNNLRAESWAAGSRRVNCSVGKQLPGGGFAPMTGTARNAPATPSAAPPPPPPAVPAPTTTGR